MTERKRKRTRLTLKITWMAMLLGILAAGSDVGICGGFPKKAKQEFEARFRESKFKLLYRPGNDPVKEYGSFLVVSKPGLPVGGAVARPMATIEHGVITLSQDFVDTFKVGDILLVGDIRFEKDSISMWVISPKPIETKNAFGGSSHEMSSSVLRFKIDPDILESGELARIYPVIEEWLQPFNSADAAKAISAKLTAPKEILIGMSIEEVTTAMGQPQTILRPAGKVVYKYKDLAIEFKEGKVSDIRY